MSGDWIKMRMDLRNHPKVVRMASALKADRLRVIGGLWAVWCTFDMHSPDGMLEGYTLQTIDDDLGWRGFGAAMQAIGWLVEAENGLQMPRFDEHNGKSAKRRSLDTERKRTGRKADECPNDVRDLSACDADTSPPHERTRSGLEKRREEKREKYPPNPPRGDVRRFPPGFDAFWSAYPRKVGKDAAARAFAKRRVDASLLASLLVAIEAQRNGEQWRKDGGQFIPHPATWLNEGRWQDETPGVATVDAVFGTAL